MQSFIQLVPSFTDALSGSLAGPVASVAITAAGNAYSNTDTVVFTRNAADTNSTDAVANVVTSDAGEVVSIHIVSGGSYSIVPHLSITTATGTGASMVATLGCDSMYLFASRSVPYADEPNPDSLLPTVSAVSFQPMLQMEFGTKIYPTSVAAMVPRNTWVANTVYAQYDDQDPDLASEKFYVVSLNGIVYKCLDNAQGSPSTVPPSASVPTQFPVTLSDGYQWLYMYTIPPVDTNLTSDMMPVYADANTVANSVDGAIYNVVVQNGGSGYPQSAGTIVSTGSNGPASVILSDQASPINGYFNGCYLTVWGNGGSVANFPITSSVAFNSNQQVNVAGAFTANQISAGYQYQIGPAVAVSGDGDGFSSYAQVSNTTGAIERVVIVGHGVGYHYANASVLTPSVYGSNAAIRAIISPIGGHGTHPRQELFSTTVGVSGTFSNTDYSNASIGANTDCTYRTIGILKNPLTYGSNSIYTGPTFNSRVAFVFAPATGQSIAAGDALVGTARGGTVIVSAWNATTFTADVSGFNGNISAGETLVDSENGSVWTLNKVEGAPDIQAYTGTTVYVRNVSTVTHSQSKPSDTFHIMLSV